MGFAFTNYQHVGCGILRHLKSYSLIDLADTLRGLRTVFVSLEK